MKGDENMTVSKNPTSYKLSLEVENGVSAIGTPHCLLYTSDAADE